MKPPLKWQQIAILTLIMAAIYLPRKLELDRFVTIDEPRWMAWSANFYYALAHGDFVNTKQGLHPGVTVTWAGTAGFLTQFPDYAEDQKDLLPGLKSVEPFLRGNNIPPIKVLAAGRVFVALFITAALIASFLVAERLVGSLTAAIGFLLIAFDPFHIALSRVLHPEALLSSLILLSLLSLLAYLYRGRRTRDLMRSGLAAGLALLTKSSALVLIPFTGLLLLLEYLNDRRIKRQGPISRLVISMAVWSAAGGVIFVLLWPVMWKEPVSTLVEMLVKVFTAASGGHANPLFFNGAVIKGDPGWLFYPLNYLWRTTPIILVGLCLALATFVKPISPQGSNDHHRWGFGLLLFVLTFSVILSLGAKKFDRYLLPIFAPLNLLAAMGWIAAGRWVAHKLTSIWSGRGLLRGMTSQATTFVVAAAVVVQIAGTMMTRPYFFSYYNPLLGGSARAPEVMMIGWGEGLDQAARYLNSKPEAEELRVISWYASGPFDYFYKGASNTLGFDETDIGKIADYDYAVLYVHQWQRQLPSTEVLAFFAEMTPEHVVRINGLEYAQIYDMRGLRNEDIGSGKIQ